MTVSPGHDATVLRLLRRDNGETGAVTTEVWLEDGHVMSRYVTRGLFFVTLLRTPAALL